MIAMLSLLLAFLSLLALINPKTPLGLNLLKIKWIRNNNFKKYYISYKSFIFQFLSIISLVQIYLIFSIIDFYRVQFFVFSILYLGGIANICFLFFFTNKKRLLKSISYTIAFIALTLGTALVFDTQIDNNNFTPIYEKTKNSSSYFLSPEDSTLISFRNRYMNEMELISSLNILHLYQEKHDFNYNLNLKKDSSNFAYSPILNQCKYLYKNRKWSRSFQLHINKIVKSYNSKHYRRKILTPLFVQPTYIFNKNFSNNPRIFASFATGSKVLIAYLINKAISTFGQVGVFLLLPILLLFSAFLTLKLAKYNEKYVKNKTIGTDYFFMFVSVFSFFIAFLSLV
jgi:hypothetical protein